MYGFLEPLRQAGVSVIFHTFDFWKGNRPTIFGVSGAHALTIATPALDSTQDSINISGTTPLLVCQDVNTKLLFTPLDELDVSQHSILLKFP